MNDDRPRFSTDEMLGSLTRWLRIMGYDTLYHRDRSDTEIIRISEGRVLLTRDKELAARVGENGIRIESDQVMDQLRQISRVFPLELDESLTRCTLCNGELDIVSPDEVQNEIPPGALQINDVFYRCRECGKVYWKGSHWIDIRARIEAMNSGEA